jgi:hypothetical protein
MDKKILELTSAVYKVLEFFPESDPLKNKAKDRALVIMENFKLIFGEDGWLPLKACLPESKEKIKNQLLEDVDVLLGYLFIAKNQGWIKTINFFIISNEYEKIKKEVESFSESTEELPIFKKPFLEKNQTENKTQEVQDYELDKPATIEKVPAFNFNISKRQARIIDFLNKNKKAQVMDLQRVLPDITKRTIRRDLDELLKSGKILRMGEFNQVFYKINESNIS